METQEIIIKKAKLGKGFTVEASYIDLDGNEISLKGKNKCHNDLRLALDKLIPFFADLTEQKEADLINWSNIDDPENVDILRKIDVSGVSRGGDESNEIITMTGRRTLATGRVLNLNSPGVEMDSETFEWPHIQEFDIAIQNFFYEVKLYITARKWEVEQKTIDFDAADPFAEASQSESVVA